MPQGQLASGQYAVGAVDTTGAVITVNVGFRPLKVNLQRVATRIGMEHYAGMAANSALKTVAAGTRTLAVANAITLTERGFTIGADADLNGAAGGQIFYEAIG